MRLRLSAAAAAFLVACLALPALAQPADTLARIRAAKSITVAHSGDSFPFSFVGKDNAPSGYSIDLCKRVIAQVGRAVGQPDLKVNWVAGTVAERITMVASGKADLDCANTSATQARMKEVDFSSLIFIDTGGFAVRADANLNRFADLSGKKVAVIAGTTTERHLQAALRKHLVNATVVTVREGPEGIAMLESGAIDAFASDKVKLVGLTAQAKNPRAFAFLADDLSYEPIAFVVPRNDSAFRLEVNRALSQVYASGDIEGIFRQWLGPLGRPSGLLAATFITNVIPE